VAFLLRERFTAHAPYGVAFPIQDSAMPIKNIFRKLARKPVAPVISGPTNVTKGSVGKLLGRGTHQHLYCPFAGYTDDVVDMQLWKYANKVGAAVHTPTFDFETLGGLGSSARGRGALRTVKPTDTLLIAGHGSATVNEISVQYRAGIWKDLSANDLATLLLLEGLGRDHVKIRMLSCWGGGLNPREKGASTEAFASVLAKAMGAYNYQNIRVAGYRGMTAWEENQTVRVDVFPTGDSKDGYVPAAGDEANISWFNMIGQKTTKPF
jgi:hypothetical protein